MSSTKLQGRTSGPAKTKALRAVAVIRVSRQGDRDADRLQSPAEQLDRCRSQCEANGWDLVGHTEEINVSGRAPLERRKGLVAAVEAIERGEADVLVVAYLDRLVRSARLQMEVAQRIEAKGGQLVAVDVGAVPGDNGSPAVKLTSGVLGLINEYNAVVYTGRVASALQKAIDDGRWPVGLQPGLKRDKDDRPVIDEDLAPIVRRAFEMRAGTPPASWQTIRGYLREHGIDRSLNGVGCMLRSRQLIGEIHYGERTGTIPAVVDPELFEAVKRTIVSRGRRPKSDRLLARQRVLHCAYCGARMVLGAASGGYYTYRCANRLRPERCPHRPAIGAEVAEGAVWAEVEAMSRQIVEAVTDDLDVAGVEADAERAQRALDRALRLALATDTADEPTALAELARLKAERDAARVEVENVRAVARNAPVVVLTPADHHKLTLDEQRDLVRALIERVEVVRQTADCTGADRLRITRRQIASAPRLAA